MSAPDTNYKLKKLQLFTEFNYIWFNKLQLV